MKRRFLPPGPRAFWQSPHMAVSLMALGCAVFVITAYASHRGLRQVSQLTAARNEAYDAMISSSRTLGDLVEMESSQRAYILTGNERFLRQFNRAEGDLQKDLPLLAGHLHTLLNDQFAARKARLDELVWRRVSSAKHNIALRQEAGFSLERFIERHQSDELAMDEFREEIGRLDALYDRQARERELEITAFQERTGLLVAGLGLGATALVSCAAWLLIRERRLRGQAESALQEFTELLEGIVQDRTNELRQAMSQIQSFAKQLDKGIETERRRLAREVHDQFGQIVTATKMMVIEMSRNHPALPQDEVGQITSLLDEAISVTRRIASELRPPLLDDLGLYAAMQLYARNLALRSKIETMVDVDDDDLLSPSQANHLFRIFQEATTNILRHAQASRIWVRGSAEDGQFQLEIADDGQGPQAIREGATGLRNMRERASLSGGTFQFGPGPNRGTVVKVVIPLRTSPAASDFIQQELP